MKQNIVENVILVDKHDNESGVEEKMKAHREGKLHRAFSLFVFNTQGHLLLQKRAKTKYHSAGLWTNTCCGHPRPGESLKKAIHRRLKEEMGFECPLKEIFHFIYHAEFDNGLFEHEYLYVFEGRSSEIPHLNKEEAGDYYYIPLDTP